MRSRATMHDGARWRASNRAGTGAEDMLRKEGVR